LSEVDSVGILPVVHAMISNTGDAKNNNGFAIEPPRDAIGAH